MSLHKCPECYKCFKHRSLLKRHARTHSTTFAFPCTSCDRQFHREDGLAVHELAAHSEGKLFTCHFCSNSYNHRSSLRRHVRADHSLLSAKKPKPSKTENATLDHGDGVSLQHDDESKSGTAHPTLADFERLQSTVSRATTCPTGALEPLNLPLDSYLAQAVTEPNMSVGTYASNVDMSGFPAPGNASNPYWPASTSLLASLTSSADPQSNSNWHGTHSVQSARLARPAPSNGLAMCTTAERASGVQLPFDTWSEGLSQQPMPSPLIPTTLFSQPGGIGPFDHSSELFPLLPDPFAGTEMQPFRAETTMSDTSLTHTFPFVQAPAHPLASATQAITPQAAAEALVQLIVGQLSESDAQRLLVTLQVTDILQRNQLMARLQAQADGTTRA